MSAYPYLDGILGSTWKPGWRTLHAWRRETDVRSPEVDIAAYPVIAQPLWLLSSGWLYVRHVSRGFNSFRHCSVMYKLGQCLTRKLLFRQTTTAYRIYSSQQCWSLFPSWYMPFQERWLHRASRCSIRMLLDCPPSAEQSRVAQIWPIVRSQATRICFLLNCCRSIRHLPYCRSLFPSIGALLTLLSLFALVRRILTFTYMVDGFYVL